MLGNILAISDEDVVQVAIIAAVSLAVLAFIWKDLMVTFFDENHARSIGLNTTLLKVMFFTLLSACTVAALQTVGACLVIAMVVTPGATAYLLTDRFGRLIVISVALGVDDQLRRRLYQLFPRRRDRRRDRHAADAAVPRGLLSSRPSTACSPRAAGASPATEAARMTTLIDWITGPLTYPFMQRALIVSVLVGGGLRGAVLLSGAEGLVADGRRHLARGAARHRARLCAGPAAGARRVRRPGSPARCSPAISRRTAA